MILFSNTHVFIIFFYYLGLFKHSKLENYSLKKLNNSIFNALNTHVFIEKLLFKTLNKCSGGIR